MDAAWACYSLILISFYKCCCNLSMACIGSSMWRRFWTLLAVLPPSFWALNIWKPACCCGWWCYCCCGTWTLPIIATPFDAPPIFGGCCWGAMDTGPWWREACDWMAFQLSKLIPLVAALPLLLFILKFARFWDEWWLLFGGWKGFIVCCGFADCGTVRFINGIEALLTAYWLSTIYWPFMLACYAC